jgi:hypothetical protein
VQSFTSESFTTLVEVELTQSGEAPGIIQAYAGVHTYTQAMWKQKKGRHMLVLPALEVDEEGYYEGSPRLVGQVETKFYLTEDMITLDRTGAIRWAHDFVSGKVQASILHLGGLVLPIVVETSRAEAEWTEDSGKMNLQFLLTSGNDHYPVEIALKFGKHI